MELYKCFSCQPFTAEAMRSGYDEYVSETLNEEIAAWAKKMKANYPDFRYRIQNADSAANPHPTMYGAKGREAIYTFIHVVYEID